MHCVLDSQGLGRLRRPVEDLRFSGEWWVLPRSHRCITWTRNVSSWFHHERWHRWHDNFRGCFGAKRWRRGVGGKGLFLSYKTHVTHPAPALSLLFFWALSLFWSNEIITWAQQDYMIIAILAWFWLRCVKAPVSSKCCADQYKAPTRYSKHNTVAYGPNIPDIVTVLDGLCCAYSSHRWRLMQVQQTIS